MWKIVPKDPKMWSSECIKYQDTRLYVKAPHIKYLDTGGSWMYRRLSYHSYRVIQLVPHADCVIQSVTPIDSSSYAHQDITEGSFMYKVSLTLHTNITSSFVHLDTTDCSSFAHDNTTKCLIYAHEDTIDCLWYAYHGTTDFIIYIPRHHWLFNYAQYTTDCSSFAHEDIIDWLSYAH